MVKIFRMLSIIFAMLAGFSSCGSVKNDVNDKPDAGGKPDVEHEQSDTELPDDKGDRCFWEDDTGHPAYSVYYARYVSVEISGKVVDDKDNGLEKIKIEPQSYSGPEVFAHTGKDGEFILAFDYDWHEGNPISSWDVDLKISDPEKIYKNKLKSITTGCQVKDPSKIQVEYFEFDCKKELVEIVLEKRNGEEPDEYENPDTETDDESTDEE
jgi:hypothetical protein